MCLRFSALYVRPFKMSKTAKQTEKKSKKKNYSSPNEVLEEVRKQGEKTRGENRWLKVFDKALDWAKEQDWDNWDLPDIF